jgi:hypothetical protein
MMASILGGRFPIIKLSNGLTVANYGSNHSYHFNTGEVLMPCSDEVCKATSLESKHTGTVQVIIDTEGGRVTVDINTDNIDDWHQVVIDKHPEYSNNKMWLDVFIDYQITDRIIDDLMMISEMNMIDIILIPYPLMDAWVRETILQKEIAGDNVQLINSYINKWKLVLSKIRTCKLEDPVTKIIYSDRFCNDGNINSIKVKLNFNQEVLLYE